MIYKRFQHYTKNGVVWTPWFPMITSSTVAELKKNCKWQLNRKLLNDYKEQ